MILKAPVAIIFDLDDTLFPSSQFYSPAVLHTLGHSPRLLPIYENARKSVKADLPKLHTSARNRQIYFKRLVELSGDETLSAIQLYDRYETELARLIREWSVQQGRLPLIRALQSRYPTYILTNETVRAQLVKIDAMCQGEPHGFKGIVCSEEVGYEKPDRRIFHRLFERYCLDPVRCLLVGDSLENDIRAAQECGLQAIQTTEFIAEESTDSTLTIRHLAELRDRLP